MRSTFPIVASDLWLMLVSLQHLLEEYNGRSTGFLFTVIHFSSAFNRFFLFQKKQTHSRSPQSTIHQSEKYLKEDCMWCPFPATLRIKSFHVLLSYSAVKPVPRSLLNSLEDQQFSPAFFIMGKIPSLLQSNIYKAKGNGCVAFHSTPFPLDLTVCPWSTLQARRAKQTAFCRAGAADISWAS